MTTTSEPARPADVSQRKSHLSFFVILILLVAIGLILCWHFNVFRSKPRIAIVVGEGPYFDLILNGAHEAENQYDVKLTVVRVKGDAQPEAIRGLLNENFDGVAISPINPTAEAGLLSEVAAKTTLVTFDSDSPVSNRLCFVGTDNYAAGRLCAEQLRKAISDGEVLISSGALDKENVQRRRQGVVDELLDRSFEPQRPTDAIDQPLKGPHFTIVATLIDVGSGEDVIAQTVKALQTHPNLKGMIGLNTASVPRLIEALRQAQKLGKVQVAGFDAASETLGGITEGNVVATIIQDQFGVGFHAVRILSENAQGNRSGLPMFQRRTLPVEVVTKDNVAAVHGELTKALQPATKPGS